MHRRNSDGQSCSPEYFYIGFYHRLERFAIKVLIQMKLSLLDQHYCRGTQPQFFPLGLARPIAVQTELTGDSR